MNWRLAGRICGAVQTFAESGKGHVEDLATGFCISVRGAVALVRFDEATRTVHVQRIFAVR
jgi:hypothetical protein